VILCDLHLPGLDGIEVLERLARISPESHVILVTAYATIETAIEAFQKGAADYLMKPIILHEVERKIRRLAEIAALEQENQWLRRELNTAQQTGDLITDRNPAMRKVLDLARKVAKAPTTVLILGESGTGKELLARAIHQLASRPGEGRFVPINCAAIPHELLENQLFGHRRGAFTGADRDTQGVFGHAGTGTVFLDEIGELPLATQAKLLRVIEQKEIHPVGAQEPMKVEARILAATNKNLDREVQDGRFRQDLYYRLNVVALTLPPLRDRRDDLPAITQALVARHSQALGKRFTGVSHEAMKAILQARWPGNVRELDNAIQRAVILGEGPLIDLCDLPADILHSADATSTETLSEAVEAFEKAHIERLLRQYPDKREAARRLGIGLSSLYRKIEQYGILAHEIA
jgi:TyrR family helix-turn-helix protein